MWDQTKFFSKENILFFSKTLTHKLDENIWSIENFNLQVLKESKTKIKQNPPKKKLFNLLLDKFIFKNKKNI